MPLLQYIKYRNIILTNASEMIDKLENEIMKQGSFTLSCKPDLMKRISDEIAFYKEDFSTIHSSYSELIDISMRMICTNSFELFETDVYRRVGFIDWNTPAGTAYQVHRMMIKYALDRGLTTQEEADEDALALKQVINERW